MKELYERWLPVVGYEGRYEISNHGRVRSLDRRIPNTRGSGTRLIKGTLVIPHGCGWKRRYLFVRLSKEGKQKNFYVHTLVLEAFIGPCPEGMEACHGANRHTDNSLQNLSWGTKGQNMQDKIRDQTTLHGERNHRSKLTADAVVNIKKLHSEGKSYKQIGELHSISHKYVWQVVKSKRWKHLNA